MTVWLGLVTTTSSWRRRKTRHSGEPPGGVVRSGNSTRPAPKQRKRCVPHSRGTASEILEEAGNKTVPVTVSETGGFSPGLKAAYLCGANRLSRLLVSLMAVTKEPATFHSSNHNT
ncbi:hypothetical protein IEQ34_023336 [Dendrobium chrysotoxum]|uniref:Uncharacterized protein n=1 Tax=Dendrobium chrysotoxum TaxID=161865 RepID=A0AAV7FVE5_DENCH|nr:hypothetical protein IEQ34_023336 [Dendrobium chrysotoxum]